MPEKLTVAIYTDSYRPAMDGVVVYVDNIAREMSRRGIRVFIVTTGKRRSDEKNSGAIQIIRTGGVTFPPYPQYRVGITPFRANRKILKENVDVIHTQTPFSMGFAGTMASRHTDAAIVSTFHSMVFDETVISSYSRSNSSMTRRLARIIRRYLKWHYSKYDLVISPSDDIAEKIKAIGIEKVRVLNNGIDLGKFHTDLARKEARKELGIGAEDRLILYLGRIGKEKDLDVLIRAADDLQKEGIRIIIAGTGPHLEFYRKLAEDSGAGNVEFFGFVPENDKLLLYRSADIFCNPSDYEVQSTVDLEAMALGTPILVPDGSSQVELAKSGISGEIFSHDDSADLARAAIEMMGKIETYRPNEVANEFSIERHVDRLVDIYREIMQKKGRVG